MIPKVGISEGKEPLFYNESHHAWREEVRKFVTKEIAPFVLSLIHISEPTRPY